MSFFNLKLTCDFLHAIVHSLIRTIAFFGFQIQILQHIVHTVHAEQTVCHAVFAVWQAAHAVRHAVHTSGASPLALINEP